MRTRSLPRLTGPSAPARTTTVTGVLSCALASDRTSTTCVPGSSVSGACAMIWLPGVDSSGAAKSPNVTQEHVQFRRLGDPTAIDFAVELNGELHSHRVARTREATLPRSAR